MGVCEGQGMKERRLSLGMTVSEEMEQERWCEEKEERRRWKEPRVEQVATSLASI